MEQVTPNSGACIQCRLRRWINRGLNAAAIAFVAWMIWHVIDARTAPAPQSENLTHGQVITASEQSEKATYRPQQDAAA